MYRRIPAVCAAALIVLLTALVVMPSADANTSDGHRHYYNARGLDTCEAPSHSQMAAFWSNTPWWWFAVYIGGENRGCPNRGLTADWVHQEVRRGWGIQPIWVGLQAPCVNQSGLARMSSNRDTSYQQGRHAGLAAYNKIVALKMNPATPIVLDMEGFNTANGSCMAAVKTYVNGWVDQLHKKPAQFPGYYGSSCASAPSEIWKDRAQPWYLWGANYDGSSNVMKMSCVSSSIWPRRLKQYKGNTYVRENGVTLPVDIDCAKGPMYASKDHNTYTCG